MSYRIVTWTQSRGIINVSQLIDSAAEARDLMIDARKANPPWLRFDLEAVADDGSFVRIETV